VRIGPPSALGGVTPLKIPPSLRRRGRGPGAQGDNSLLVSQARWRELARQGTP
jgi:hypothetical protein